MFYQAYQRVGYGTADCTHTRTRPQVIQQGRTRYQVIFPRVYRTYQSAGYGWGSRTNLTKVSGTGGEVVPILPKCRVRVWMPYQTYQRVGYGYGCCTKLTKGSGTGKEVVPSLPEGRVRVWMFHQAYQRVGYGTAACTRTRPRVFQQDCTRYDGIFPRAISNLLKCRVRVGRSYQAYQSVGYGYGGRTKPTTGSGTGMDVQSLPKGQVRIDVVPNLPKGRVRVWMFYQAYQRVGYGTATCTRTRTRPWVVQQGRTRY